MSGGYAAELEAAKKTLHQRAAPVTRMFARKVGAVSFSYGGRWAGPTESVIDHKYWFAKLYELMTYYEIGAHEKFTHPGFIMHFIPVFYDLYYDAVQSFMAGDHKPVSDLWMRHFRGPTGRASPTAIDTVMFSVVTGVTAHIQGDMAFALETAYRTWAAKPKPAFAALYDDFFLRNRPIFAVGRAEFFLDVGQKTQSAVRPEVAQLMIGIGEQVAAGGLDVDEVHTWRTAAWRTAERKLAVAELDRDDLAVVQGLLANGGGQARRGRTDPGKPKSASSTAAGQAAPAGKAKP
jgi:hypothetical protein